MIMKELIIKPKDKTEFKMITKVLKSLNIEFIKKDSI